MIIDINILLAWGAVYKKLGRGEVIFSEGSECSYYNQLVSGIVKWVNIDDDGKAELITGTPRGGVAIYWNASSAPVGINQIINNTLISYPNPCESIFYIDIPWNEKLNLLRVTDLMGIKKDIPFSLQNNQIKLESSSLVPGFYVVDIQTNQHRYSSKFIKK